MIYPNIIFLGIDSLRADHMSCYGYEKKTTPHIDKLAREGVRFTNNYNPNIPTTPGYACMLTGMDVISTQVVALRHKGELRAEVNTLPEILRTKGYKSTCIGFTGNPSSRGFDEYLDYKAWGSWDEGRLEKAGNLNNVAIPRLEKYLKSKEPFLLFLRHMDPHPPYLPPAQFERIFYHGNECDPKNRSMEPVMSFRPFRDCHASWMPPGISDINYVKAQYDGELAYMDSCIQNIIQVLDTNNILDETIIVINADHGETLDEHDCYFDHHGLYETNLHIPLIIRYPKKLPKNKLIQSFTSHQDLVPTLLELIGLDSEKEFDGESLVPLIIKDDEKLKKSFYITECTWMRKHGWRTPEWKLIIALEPDFHYKPEIELYNLLEDPEEENDLAEKFPEQVKNLLNEMNEWLEERKIATGLETPIHNQGDWHGYEGIGSFKTSDQAYETLYLGHINQGKVLQEKKT